MWLFMHLIHTYLISSKSYIIIKWCQMLQFAGMKTKVQSGYGLEKHSHMIRNMILGLSGSFQSTLDYWWSICNQITALCFVWKFCASYIFAQNKCMVQTIASWLVITKWEWQKIGWYTKDSSAKHKVNT